MLENPNTSVRETIVAEETRTFWLNEQEHWVGLQVSRRLTSVREVSVAPKGEPPKTPKWRVAAITALTYGVVKLALEICSLTFWKQRTCAIKNNRGGEP